MLKISTALNAQFAYSIKSPTFRWSETMKGHKIKING